jgi:hypothetical protein
VKYRFLDNVVSHHSYKYAMPFIYHLTSMDESYVFRIAHINYFQYFDNAIKSKRKLFFFFFFLFFSFFFLFFSFLFFSFLFFSFLGAKISFSLTFLGSKCSNPNFLGKR